MAELSQGGMIKSQMSLSTTMDRKMLKDKILPKKFEEMDGRAESRGMIKSLMLLSATMGMKLWRATIWCIISFCEWITGIGRKVVVKTQMLLRAKKEAKICYRMCLCEWMAEPSQREVVNGQPLFKATRFKKSWRAMIAHGYKIRFNLPCCSLNKLIVFTTFLYKITS